MKQTKARENIKEISCIVWDFLYNLSHQQKISMLNEIKKLNPTNCWYMEYNMKKPIEKYLNAYVEEYELKKGEIK